MAPGLSSSVRTSGLKPQEWMNVTDHKRNKAHTRTGRITHEGHTKF